MRYNLLLFLEFVFGPFCRPPFRNRIGDLGAFDLFWWSSTVSFQIMQVCKVGSRSSLSIFVAVDNFDLANGDRHFCNSLWILSFSTRSFFEALVMTWNEGVVWIATSLSPKSFSLLNRIWVEI